MTVTTMDRRRSPDYQQVAIHIPKDLARQFKALCSLNGLAMSDVGEALIREWVKSKQDELKVKD